MPSGVCGYLPWLFATVTFTTAVLVLPAPSSASTVMA